MTSVAPSELARQLVADEREVAGRRARDVATRPAAAALIADLLAVLALMSRWSGSGEARLSGMQVSITFTGVVLVGMALREVVLRAAIAAPDNASYPMVLFVAAGSVLSGLVVWNQQPRIVTAVTGDRAHPVPPIAFGVAFLAGAAFACLAAVRIRQTIRDVDLLEGTFVGDPALLHGRLADATDDALRRSSLLPRRATRLAPSRSAPRLRPGLARLIDSHRGRDELAGRGSAQRLVRVAPLVLLATLAATALPWYYEVTAGGVTASSDRPLAPFAFGVAAVLALAGPGLGVRALRSGRRLVASCLVAAVLCAVAASRCLTVAGTHTGSRQPLGPAAWLGLIGFVFSGTLALLAASALYQPARLNLRQRRELSRAQVRLDAARPGWPTR